MVQWKLNPRAFGPVDEVRTQWEYEVTLFRTRWRTSRLSKSWRWRRDVNHWRAATARSAGLVTELPLGTPRITYVRDYASKDWDVSEGHRHQKTYCVAAEAVETMNFLRDVAEDTVREFNDNHCHPPLDDAVIRNQVKDAARYAKHGVRRIPETPQRSVIELVAPELPLESATIPSAPNDDELREAYRGTAWGVWADEVHKVAEDINPMFCITSAMTLQSVLMTPCVLGPRPRLNAYGMLGSVTPPEARGRTRPRSKMKGIHAAGI